EIEGKRFFMGFTKVILAMKKCPKFVVSRVQGKVVGGAVGILSASDYNLAYEVASIRLSELALGIGPFIIAPVVEKKLGFGAYTALAVDTDWRDSEWAEDHGLFAKVFDSIEKLDHAVEDLAETLSGFNPEGMSQMKRIFWEGTDHWDRLLEARAEISGSLVRSEYTKNAIAAFENR
ncbi:MAG TPA: enoyl-CoA hydratase-related protein, partial [bacterium]